MIPFELNCWKEIMTLDYNTTSNTFQNTKGVEIKVSENTHM